jgi:hypothetical protein
VPIEACTLPTEQQPLRVAAFDALFAEALAHATMHGPTAARLTLIGHSDLPTRVQALADQESACCSFFTFTVTRFRTAPKREADDASLTGVHLDVSVPPSQVTVLAGLVDRARAASALRAVS